MKTVDTKLLHSVWARSRELITKEKTDFDLINFNDFVASIFCPGPFCFFVVDFFDMQIVSVSPNFKSILAIKDDVTFDSIIATIHPDDMAFVAKAEQACLDHLYNKLGRDKVLKYKMNYCFRAKSAQGDYRMFSHQAIVLTVDEKGGFGKSLNIVTDISHLASVNNFKISMIGISGEPSFQNVDIDYDPRDESISKNFSSREIEIVKLISEGLQSKQIAARLNISLHTVSTHRKNILAKSGLKSTGNLIARCIQEGLF